MRTRADVVAAARECVGTPFVHQGRALGRGMDCVGIAIHCARRAGFYDGPDIDGYGVRPSGGLLLERLREHLDEVDEGREGDVLVIAFRRDPQHLAIVTGPSSIVHAYAHPGLARAVEQPLDRPWRDRVRAVFRFRGIADG